MRTLLVHDSDYKQVEKVNTWREKREGINDFFQLSMNDASSCILNEKKDEDVKFLEKQIQKAIDSYGVRKVLVFLSKEYEELPRSILEELLPDIRFVYVVHH